MSNEPQRAFGADPKPYYLAVAALVLLEFLRRTVLGYVPDDFTAYLSAADVFVSGGHPYGEAIFAAARYNGKVYNYLPGTLWFIAPLAWLPTTVAVALDWVARIAAVGFALRVFARRLVPDMKLQFVLLLALFHEPLTVDLLFGNFTSYLLGAFALTVWAAHREDGWGTRAAAFVAGLVLAFKPFWVLGGLYVLASRRRWLPALSAALGAGTIVLLSLPYLDILPEYLARINEMADFYYSVALMTFAPWAIPIVGAAWLGAGVWLARNVPEDAWIWGACTIPFWPRLGTYSYVITIPLLLFFIARLGPRWGVLIALVFVGPLPWLLRTAPGFEDAFILEAWTHWIWVWAAAVGVFVLLRKGARIGT